MYVTLDAQSDLPYYSWLILLLNWVLMGGGGGTGLSTGDRYSQMG